MSYYGKCFSPELRCSVGDTLERMRFKSYWTFYIQGKYIGTDLNVNFWFEFQLAFDKHNVYHIVNICQPHLNDQYYGDQYDQFCINEMRHGFNIYIVLNVVRMWSYGGCITNKMICLSLIWVCKNRSNVLSHILTRKNMQIYILKKVKTNNNKSFGILISFDT